MSEKARRIEASSEVKEPSGGGFETRTVPMKLYIPEDMPTHYADSFNVFFSDYDFTLSFFQTQSPLITNDDDWDKVEVIKAKCVSRVVIAPHFIPRIINILTENWQRFVEARQAQLKERENVSTSAEAGAENPPAEGDKS